MTKNKLYSLEFKKAICLDYFDNNLSYKDLFRKYQIPMSNIKNWIRYYRVHGDTSFNHPGRKYPAALRLKIVKEYLSGGVSSNVLALKYNLCSGSIVIHWVKKYNRGDKFKDYTVKGRNPTMKEKKTFFEERKTIVEYYFSHGENRKETANHFNINYSTLCNWISRYKQYGESSLNVKPRGRAKKGEHYFKAISMEDKLKLDILELNKRIKDLELKLELNKKKDQLTKQLREEFLESVGKKPT